MSAGRRDVGRAFLAMLSAGPLFELLEQTLSFHDLEQPWRCTLDDAEVLIDVTAIG